MPNYTPAEADALLGPDPGTAATPSATPGEKFDANSADAFLGPAPAQPQAPDPLSFKGVALNALGAIAPVMRTPGVDTWLANSGAGRVLDAMGVGATQNWGEDNLGLSDQGADALKKAGIFNDVSKGQTSIVRAFNEGLIRPAAIALDAANRAASSAYAGVQAGVMQAGTELGMPEAGRTLAEIPDAFMGSPHMLEAAKDAHAVGQPEGVYMGTQEAAPEKAAAAPVPTPAEAAAPTPAPEAPREPAPPPADVHEAARQIAPDVFAEYDPLQAHVEALRQQIADATGDLQKQAEAQVPNAARISELEGRLAEADDPKKAAKYQEWLDALTPARDEFVNSGKMALLTRDTPEIAAMRQELQEADYRLRDLAPDVTAAYGEAAKQFPVEEAAPAEVAPAPEPAPQAEQAPVAKAPNAEAAPAVEAAKPAPVADIAADVSQKLQAAGRPAEEAEAAGQVTKALWETRAARFEGKKGTAEEMYAREAPDIRAGEGAKVAAFAQKGRELNQTPFQGSISDPRSPAYQAMRERINSALALYKQSLDRVARYTGREDLGSRRSLELANKSLAENKDLIAMMARHLSAEDKADLDELMNGKPTLQIGHEVDPYKDFFKDLNGREYSQEANGKIRLMDSGRSVIELMKTANASTFLHETAHDWLERLLKDAADPAAPDQMRADAAAVRSYLKVGDDWAGRKPNGKPDVTPHEKFARSFERYMMEGRAPSTALANVFGKFRQWLTTIYQTVAKLRAPITDDIRDVFDRLLAKEPERQASIVPEKQAEMEFAPSEPKAESPLYPKLPKEPPRITAWVRKLGGIKDEGGELKNMLGGKKLPGFLNKSGRTLDEMTEQLWHDGYLPEFKERPSIQDMLAVLDDDLNDRIPRYSEHDDAARQEYENALAHNDEIERLASRHSIDTTGMTREQFFEELSKQLSLEKQAEEHESMGAAHEEDYGAAVDELHADQEARHEPSEPQTDQELEDAFRQENSAGAVGQGPQDAGESPGVRQREGAGEVGAGQGERNAGDAGRDGEAPGQSAGGGGVSEGARGGEGESESIPPLKVEGEPKKFTTKRDEDVLKAANIRLDKLNASDDVNKLLMQIAEQNGDFMDARYGSKAYSLQQMVLAHQTLLNAVGDEAVAAGQKYAESGKDEDWADWQQKVDRAAMVAEEGSAMRADISRGLSAYKKVRGRDELLQSMQQMTKGADGRTLFQRQQAAAALISKLESAQQVGKFASDLNKSGWETTRDRIIAYYVNALISGPITHMAYMVGNETMMLYRAVPETAAAAALGAIRRDADRVYFGEIGAQLYGQLAGARAGIFPAWQALKTGIADLPGDVQGELPIGSGARGQVLPGKLGYALETPSRVVTAIHTLFYTMNYSSEIARLAYREAASKGLAGFDFDAEVARLKSAPTPEMMDQATSVATRGVLMKRPEVGSLQADFAKIMNNPHPAMLPVKLAAPFMQIGMNILEEGLVERTPLSMLSGQARAELSGAMGGAARDLRIAKIATGSMLGAAAFGLAAQGLITGGDDPDPKKRAVAQDLGWKAYSIKIGNTYIPYRKYLGPLGPLVSVAADIHQIGAKLDDESLTKVAASTAFAFSEVVADETWMAGLSSFVQAATNWDTDGERWLRSTATSFLPFSSAMNQTARLVDPYQRQARTMLDAVANKIPGASEELAPQIGLWGQPVGGHMMISPSQARQDPVDQRLQALDRGFAPVQRKILGVPLTDGQYADYARISGMQAHMSLTALVNAPGFTNLPADDQFNAMTKVRDAAIARARALIQLRYPDITKQAIANKQSLHAAR